MKRCVECGTNISNRSTGRCRSCAAKRRWDGRRIVRKTIAELLAEAPLLDGEEWRGVVEFEGYYQVSNMGRVRRVARGPGTRPGYILKPKPAGHGYRAVTLSVNDVNYYKNIHSLVADAFLALPDVSDARLEINHIDGDKTNNALSNLEYVTSSQNKKHSAEVFGTWCGENNGMSKLTESQVSEIKSMLRSGEYMQSEIADKFCVSPATISDINRDQCWNHVK